MKKGVKIDKTVNGRILSKLRHILCQNSTKKEFNLDSPKSQVATEVNKSQNNHRLKKPKHILRTLFANQDMK